MAAMGNRVEMLVDKNSKLAAQNRLQRQQLQELQRM